VAHPPGPRRVMGHRQGGELQRTADEEQRQVVAGRAADQPEQRREQQVELEGDEQEVEVVVAGSRQQLVAELWEVTHPRRGAEGDPPVDDRPDDTGQPDVEEPARPETTEPHRGGPLGVAEHEGAEDEERPPGEVQEGGEGSGGDAVGAHRGGDGVHADDADERQQPDDVHLIEVTPPRPSVGGCGGIQGRRCRGRRAGAPPGLTGSRPRRRATPGPARPPVAGPAFPSARAAPRPRA